MLKFSHSTKIMLIIAQKLGTLAQRLSMGKHKVYTIINHKAKLIKVYKQIKEAATYKDMLKNRFGDKIKVNIVSEWT